MKLQTEALIALLRSTDRTSRVCDIARALSFEPETRRIPRTRWHTLGLDPDATRATLASIGRRTGATAWCLHFNDAFDTAATERTARALQNADLRRHALLFAADKQFHTLAIASPGPDGITRICTIDRRHPRASDAETLADMIAPPDEGTASITLRYARALDRARVTGRFFDDFRARRAAIAAAWSGLPSRQRQDRDRLAMLLLCRLMFLYFLQHAGHLAGNRRFLPELVRRTDTCRISIYRAAIIPLFFGALNRRPEHRTARARALGDLPYLNGGLFDRHALERRYPRLDLPDDALLETFDVLLERYRFTTREPADTFVDTMFDGAIDPEMLGRVFEGVMDRDRRSATGAFYTPATAVDRLVRDALTAWLTPGFGSENATLITTCRATDPATNAAAATALTNIRVLDPACGSGAFLLGALSRIGAIRTAATTTDLEPATIRRDIVGTSLHGVDIDADAALLCALRLWLALADSTTPVQPLPNLDRRIRQGDALLDPIDLAFAELHDRHDLAAYPDVRRASRELLPLTEEYLRAEAHQRDRLRSRVDALERSIARAWIDALRDRNHHRLRELRAAAADRDLFGLTPDSAHTAKNALESHTRLHRQLAQLRARIRDDRETPFFSFRVHFAEASSHGFDLVLSNPPWVRAHNVPATSRNLARRRYHELTRGWTLGTRLAGAPPAAAAQTDLALLFLERAISLLAPGGVLGLLLPAKFIRSLYAGTARARLLSETPILTIHDCGLDQHAIFRADAFAASIVARKPDPAHATPPDVHIRLVRRDRRELCFHTPRHDLPLFPDDPASPWLLAPEPARAALRRMQKAGPPIGLHESLRTRRGVFTGANAILLIARATPHLHGLATIQAAGFGNPANGPADYFEATIESATLRPAIRGTDIRPWSWKSERLLIFLHDADGRPTRPPPRLAQYLDRHANTLDRRSGTTAAFPRGAVFRVTRDTLAPKVAWHDLASTLEATALPATTRSCLGDNGPLIPLNTTYFIPTPDHDHALVLAAFLNSSPLRAFARTIAERAKDTRFRFFAWTIGALPLPTDWFSCANRLLPIARAAHAQHGLDPIDQDRLDYIIARAYRLTPDQLDQLRNFHDWLGPQP